MEIVASTIDKVLTDLASQPDPRWKTLDLDKQRKQIQAELNSSAPKDAMMRVMTRMQFQEAPDLGEIDWESELATFEHIEYPQYYQYLRQKKTRESTPCQEVLSRRE